MKMRYYYSHNKWELIDVSDPALIDYIEKQNKECQREFWREKKRRTLSLDALLEANVVHSLHQQIHWKFLLMKKKKTRAF